MNVLKGIPVSEGIVFGRLKAYKKDCFGVHSVKVHTKDHDQEISRFTNAKKLAMEQLDELYKNALKDIGEQQAAIFDAHKMMLDDIF